MIQPVLWTSTHTSGTAAHMIAAASGLKLELRFISLRAGDHKKPDYLKINPKAQVPALVLTDGTVITEIPAIASWFAVHAPASGLLPATHPQRAKALEWLAFCHWTLGTAIGPAFNPTRLTGGDEAAGAKVRAAALERLATALATANDAIGEKDTLLGTPTATAADIFLFWIANLAGFFKIDLAPMPGIRRLQAKVAAMPAIVEALARERIG